MTKDSTIEILSDITVFSKYARFLKEKMRREVWDEVVTRNMDMHIRKFPDLEEEIREAYQYVFDKKVLPSMRALQFSGKPIEINPARQYNCAFTPIDDIAAFSEIMFLLLGGSGVGFSVQQHHIEKLPEIRKPNKSKSKRFLINDSIEGWADAVKFLMKSYFKGGSTINFDYGDIREKGAELVTAGGKAPGPEPLKNCIERVTAILETKKDGERLASIEVHDIVCHLADAVLAGGIRRAALLSMFSVGDEDMVACKGNFDVISWEHAYVQVINEQGEPVKVVVKHEDQTGKVYYDLKVQCWEPYYGEKDVVLNWVSKEDVDKLKETGTLPWYYFQPQRGRSNNSVTLVRSRVKKEVFDDIWKRVETSGSGEPGFVFINDKDSGFNPCAEIGLKSNQFCNLVETNVSNIESQEDLNNRVRAAAFIGTLQASYTDFHYLRPIWQKTTEKEALLGVSMTGIASNVVFDYDLKEAAEVVKEENARVAKIIGINKAARCTTVKPAGTSSLVVGTSSGIHAWHAPYYVRRMRLGKNEDIYKYLVEEIPELIEDDFFSPYSTAVLSVPQKAPEGAILRTESPLELLDRIKYVYENWILPGHRSGMNTHNISATVSIKVYEWDEVGEWMWENKDYYNGLSVLPFNDHTYKQAPFEDISEEKFKEMKHYLKDIDLRNVYEEADYTDLSGEVACGGGACEITEF
jgi:ribonucleoside-diphosphate reductase alpha chain